jgi:long-chain acyl-CoA synthetase
MITADGWLNSGDTARIDDQGHVHHRPAEGDHRAVQRREGAARDMEAAIARDPLFEQVMLLGEGKPFLSVMVVLNADHWKKLAAARHQPRRLGIARRPSVSCWSASRRRSRSFPGYAQVRRATLTLEPWTVENGLLTPTMKLKRAKVMEKFNTEIDRMYAGH